MSCEMDYRSVSQDARIVAAVAALRAAGASPAKAKTLVALSVSEASAIWIEKRIDPGLMPDGAACWPCRIVVGWEFGKDGAGNIAWRSQLGSNPEALAVAQKLGIAIPGAGGNIYPPGTTITDKDAFAAFFEHVVLNRWSDQLVHFSLGPTQMHLVWTGLAPGSKHASSWPDSWEAIWKLYTSQTVSSVLPFLAYLDADRWPADAPEDREVRVSWLIKETGGRYWAEKYDAGVFHHNLGTVLRLTAGK